MIYVSQMSDCLSSSENGIFDDVKYDIVSM